MTREEFNKLNDAVRNTAARELLAHFGLKVDWLEIFSLRNAMEREEREKFDAGGLRGYATRLESYDFVFWDSVEDIPEYNRLIARLRANHRHYWLETESGQFVHWGVGAIDFPEDVAAYDKLIRRMLSPRYWGFDHFYQARVDTLAALRR